MSMCSNQRTEARHGVTQRRLSEPLLGRIVQTLCATARQHPGASLSTRRVDHQLDINWPLSHQPHMRVSTPVTNATVQCAYFHRVPVPVWRKIQRSIIKKEKVRDVATSPLRPPYTPKVACLNFGM